MHCILAHSVAVTRKFFAEVFFEVKLRRMDTNLWGLQA